MSRLESSSDATGYDIIGDVHGCAHSLEQLLQKLGYAVVDGAYEFGGDGRRQAIFVGDIIDRGPQIREALQIVRSMVERGSARMILGNHEYNALAYCTFRKGTGHDGAAADGAEFIREHTVRHTM